MKTLARCVRIAVVAAVPMLGLAGGCSSTEAQASKFRSNPTPEIDSLSQRRTDIDNKLTIVNDTNLRTFNEDFGRLFLMEKPSQLTPQPSGW